VADFQDVYNLYFRDVYRYALSICRNASLAEEITQETFYKALSRIDSFEGNCKIFVWLCQIAKNTYISMCRKAKHRENEADMALDMFEPNMEDMYFIKESALAIHTAWRNLDEPYKEVFSLRVFGELSFSQIADLFGKTESWARVTYHRAKLRIKEVIK